MSVTSSADAAYSLGHITANQFEGTLDALSVDELDRLARLSSLTEEQARVLSAHLLARAESLCPTRNRRADGGELHPLAQRLVAWWHGYAGSPAKTDSNGFIVEVADMGSEPAEPAEPWSKQQIRAIQMTWGEGFMEPGGRAFGKRLLGLAKVTSNHSVLDLTTGLGGTAANAAKDDGLWIDALEPDPDLAERAREFVNSWGLSDRVKVNHADFDNLELPARHYDVAFSRERLFAIKNKKQVLQRVADSLKRDGALLLVDFTIADEHANHEDLNEWMSTEPRRPFPWSSEFYRQALEHLGFEVRYNQDISEDYTDLINQSWLKSVRKINDGEVDPQIEKYLMEDGEIWLARAKAMKAGVLSTRKIHAVLRNAPDPE